jgi:hypothetical protein
MVTVLQDATLCVRQRNYGYKDHAVCRHGLSSLMHSTRQQTRPQQVL